MFTHNLYLLLNSFLSIEPWTNAYLFRISLKLCKCESSRIGKRILEQLLQETEYKRYPRLIADCYLCGNSTEHSAHLLYNVVFLRKLDSLQEGFGMHSFSEYSKLDQELME